MRKPNALALIATASPDLEKQSFSAVVFINREYSEEQEKAPEKKCYFFFRFGKKSAIIPIKGK